MSKFVAGHVTKVWFLKLWIAFLNRNFALKLQGNCWKDDVVTFSAHLSVTIKRLTSYKQKVVLARLQNRPYFCVFKYARAVKQKVWNEADSYATLYRILYWFWEKTRLFCSLVLQQLIFAMFLKNPHPKSGRRRLREFLLRALCPWKFWCFG